jgi:hypothetical protein
LFRDNAMPIDCDSQADWSTGFDGMDRPTPTTIGVDVIGVDVTVNGAISGPCAAKDVGLRMSLSWELTKNQLARTTGDDDTSRRLGVSARGVRRDAEREARDVRRRRGSE